LPVVPPEAASQTAHHALVTAGGRDNADSVASLLLPVGTSSQTVGLDRAEGETTEHDWVLDGGSVSSR